MSDDPATRRPDGDAPAESNYAAQGNCPVALSVIAPCYNEEGNIETLADRTLATFDAMGISAELVLIDDASRDGTWDQISRCIRGDARIRGFRHGANGGMVSAWRTALNVSRGELVCLIDADLQNRPEDIARLREAFLKGSRDVVQAVRLPAEGVRRLSLFSGGLNRLLNVTFGTRLRDNKSGFVLCRRETLTRILEHRYRYRYFQCFIAVSAAAQGLTIGELETVFEQRRCGQSFLSSFPVLVSARIVWELIKFRVEVRRTRTSTAASRRHWPIPTSPVEGPRAGAWGSDHAVLADTAARGDVAPGES